MINKSLRAKDRKDILLVFCSMEGAEQIIVGKSRQGRSLFVCFDHVSCLSWRHTPARMYLCIHKDV